MKGINITTHLLHATPDDVFNIAGFIAFHNVWSRVPEPKLFLKDGEPFGIMSFVIIDGIMYINSISKDDAKFTFEMHKELVRQIRSHDKVLLASTCKNSTAIHKLMDEYHECGINSYFIKGL